MLRKQHSALRLLMAFALAAMVFVLLLPPQPVSAAEVNYAVLVKPYSLDILHADSGKSDTSFIRGETIELTGVVDYYPDSGQDINPQHPFLLVPELTLNFKVYQGDHLSGGATLLSSSQTVFDVESSSVGYSSVGIIPENATTGVYTYVIDLKKGEEDLGDTTVYLNFQVT